MLGEKVPSWHMQIWAWSDKRDMKRITRQRLFGLSVESIFQCACSVPLRSYMSSSLAEALLCRTAYMNEQRNFAWTFVVCICFNGTFPMVLRAASECSDLTDMMTRLIYSMVSGDVVNGQRIPRSDWYDDEVDIFYGLWWCCKRPANSLTWLIWCRGWYILWSPMIL